VGTVSVASVNVASVMGCPRARPIGPWSECLRQRRKSSQRLIPRGQSRDRLRPMPVQNESALGLNDGRGLY